MNPKQRILLLIEKIIGSLFIISGVILIPVLDTLVAPLAEFFGLLFEEIGIGPTRIVAMGNVPPLEGVMSVIFLGLVLLAAGFYSLRLLKVYQTRTSKKLLIFRMVCYVLVILLHFLMLIS